jgi:hypothetical protein
MRPSCRDEPGAAQPRPLLDMLRRHPATAALINAEAGTTGSAVHERAAQQL